MTQEELQQAFLDKGYKRKLFPAFLREYKVNIDVGCSELEALEKSYIFAAKYEEQKKLGFSDKWAKEYAQRAEDGYDQMSIFEDMERIEESDVRLFAHHQHKGQMYEDVFVNVYTNNSLGVPCGYSIFGFVEEYINRYNEVISEGRTDIYAEAYLDSLYSDDAEPDIFARAVEEAITNGYAKEDAHYFAATCSFRYDYDGDRIPNAVKYLIKYKQQWQHSYIFHWLAKALASANFVYNEEDFCKIFEHNCKLLKGNISEEDLLDIVSKTIKEYSYTHSK